MRRGSPRPQEASPARHGAARRAHFARRAHAGLIRPLPDRVLAAALRQASAWRQEGLGRCRSRSICRRATCARRAWSRRRSVRWPRGPRPRITSRSRSRKARSWTTPTARCGRNRDVHALRAWTHRFAAETVARRLTAQSRRGEGRSLKWTTKPWSWPTWRARPFRRLKLRPRNSCASAWRSRRPVSWRQRLPPALGHATIPSGPRKPGRRASSQGGGVEYLPFRVSVAPPKGHDDRDCAVNVTVQDLEEELAVQRSWA